MSKKKAHVGRPSKYDPAYCEEVVTALADGFSLAGFAGKIGVSRSTISEWASAHPEFSVACSRAKAASAWCWEKRANRVGEVGGGPGTAQVVMFALKNMAPDDWSYEKRARVNLPGIDSPKAAMAAIAEAVAAFAKGELDASHAEAVVSMARSYIGAAEITELAARIAALEGGSR